MTVECDRCEVRGLACGNCAATFIVAADPVLGPAELRALAVLANAGMIPPLRYAPRLARASLYGSGPLPEVESHTLNRNVAIDRIG
jgi:hypothetical protein